MLLTHVYVLPTAQFAELLLTRFSGLNNTSQRRWETKVQRDRDTEIQRNKDAETETIDRDREKTETRDHHYVNMTKLYPFSF
jgi:hypothetical protein